jgi:hypothetical protein
MTITTYINDYDTMIEPYPLGLSLPRPHASRTNDIPPVHHPALHSLLGACRELPMLPLPLAILGELILLWRVSLQMRLQSFLPSSNWRRSVTIFDLRTWCYWPQRRDGHAEDDGNQQEPVTIVCVQADEVRHSLGS